MKPAPSYPYDVIYAWQLWMFLIPAILLTAYFLHDYITELMQLKKGSSYDRPDHARDALEARQRIFLSWIWPLVLLWLGFRYIPMFFRWLRDTTKEAKELA